MAHIFTMINHRDLCDASTGDVDICLVYAARIDGLDSEFQNKTLAEIFGFYFQI